MKIIKNSKIIKVIGALCIIFSVLGSRVHSQSKNFYHHLELFGGITSSLFPNSRIIHTVDYSHLNGGGCFKFQRKNVVGFNFGILHNYSFVKKINLKTGIMLQNRNLNYLFFPHQCGVISSRFDYNYKNIFKVLNVEIPIYITYTTQNFEIGIGFKSDLYHFERSYIYDENNTLISLEKSRGASKSYGMRQIIRPSIWLGYKINAITKFGLSIFTNIESRDLNSFKFNYIDWTLGLAFGLK